MKTYDFAIVASGLDPASEDFESRFYDAGCDDATISFQRGVIIVDFAREAASIGEAIASAAANVTGAGAVIERIEPDPLVSLSDIAARASLSRAAASNYGKALRGKNFPAPVARVTSDSPLWEWADVSRWLYLNHKAPREMMVEARAIRAANEALDADPTQIGERIRRSLSELEGAL
ncbi:MAG: hypothetical protein ACR2F8_02810 [Caulobacteraceae bacterium]